MADSCHVNGGGPPIFRRWCGLLFVGLQLHPPEWLGRVWWVLKGFFPTKRALGKKLRADSQTRMPG